ncbi:hypothetical protein [Fundidesulfovibrio soli]|uniref:hypothetical protein n=1 Tax=Fundidesulfovibrio soli TaxID=2922716 RepID=UPI001FAF4AA8|nr:hypothetical protein [Fundidesulfovibrio soli]
MNALRWTLLLLLCSVFCLGTSERKRFWPSNEQTRMGYFSGSPRNPVTNAFFSAYMTPLTAGKVHPDCKQAFNALEISITNLHHSDIAVDWGKSKFLYECKERCGFQFKGGKEIEKDCGQIQPDIIPSKGVLRKVVFPYALVGWNDRIWNTPFVGDVGLLLSITADGQEVQERLLIHVDAAQ